MEGKWIFLPLRDNRTVMIQFINSLIIWGPSNDSDLGNGLQPRGIRLDAQDDRAKRKADSKARGTTHRDVQYARTGAETRHHAVLPNGQAFFSRVYEVNSDSWKETWFSLNGMKSVWKLLESSPFFTVRKKLFFNENSYNLKGITLKKRETWKPRDQGK